MVCVLVNKGMTIALMIGRIRTWSRKTIRL
jgi:hypothetical protein